MTALRRIMHRGQPGIIRTDHNTERTPLQKTAPEASVSRPVRQAACLPQGNPKHRMPIPDGAPSFACFCLHSI